MSDQRGPIESFVAAVQQRLNRYHSWTTLVWTFAGGAGFLVVLGLWYTLRGYAVPGGVIAVTLTGTLVVGLVWWRLRQFTLDAAAGVCDRFFRLHDAVTSYLHFSRVGKKDGYYALQAAQTCDRVRPLDPTLIRYEPPKRGIVLAAGLVALAIPLSLRGPSEAVLRERELAIHTNDATAAINNAFAKKIDELSEETDDPNEKELLNPDKLRKWVDELKQTPDHKEALRQYAELERRLNETRLATQNKRDEHLLERAAHELETTRETQPLAEDLKQKNYDRAAEQLAKMTPRQSTEPLDKQRQELARLKAAAQHLAAAARAARLSPKDSKTAANSNRAKSQSASSNSKSGNGPANSAGAEGAPSEGSGEMAQTMEDLSESVSDLDKSLAEAKRQESQQGQCDAKTLSQCQARKQSVAMQLAKLGNQLKKLGMCKRCDARLGKLCSMCSQCQGGLCQSAAMCLNPKAGGKKPGTGTVASRRDQTDELVDNGQTTQLKGIKGAGPSLTTVEAADEGSGTSTQTGDTQQRAFKRQFESFVSREDVPEQVKTGVKRYFEVIHETQTQPAQKGGPQ
jgi:hypothetical protein